MGSIVYIDIYVLYLQAFEVEIQVAGSTCSLCRRSEYPSHQGGFLVLHGWLLAFPHLAPLLELLTGLAQGEAVQYVAELLKARWREEILAAMAQNGGGMPLFGLKTLDP